VIGDNHKGKTLYRWGEYPDYVWKGFGEEGTHSKYEGDVENGKPNGLFLILSYKVGFKIEFLYGKFFGYYIIFLLIYWFLKTRKVNNLINYSSILPLILYISISSNQESQHLI
jgi:hypothetical protein